MEIGETLRCESAAAWREWLTEHHGDRREIWLVNDRKGPAQRTIPYADALDEATCFGWIDGMIKRLDEAHFVQRWSPRRPRGNWTEGNRERARRLHGASRMRPAGYTALPADLREELIGRDVEEGGRDILDRPPGSPVS